jgi:hypothetical protein
MTDIPTNEYFPGQTDDTGKVILFHVYVDTFLLTEDGGANQENAINTNSSDSDFIKIVTTKFRRNFVSLLRSITNSSCANLSQHMLSHLFDEDGNLYVCDNYKKSAFALLTENNVKVSQFYTIDLNTDAITTKLTDKECNIAYFTFKLRFKYKLLDFVVQFELGHGIYQDQNQYNENDTTINGNLLVTSDLNVNNNAYISKNLTVSCNSTFAKNATVSGSTLLNGAFTVGDSCNSHDVKIYGGDENDDNCIFWDASESILSVQGELIVGSETDVNPLPAGDGINDVYDVIFHGVNNSKLTWKSHDDELELTSKLVVTDITQLKSDVTIGTATVGANLTIHGSDTSGNQINWDKNTDKLRIKGHLHVGEVGTGYTVRINSSNQSKYIEWNPDTYKLQINGNICGGEECVGSTMKLWGIDSGKYLLWDHSINKLRVIGNLDVGNSTNLQTTTLFGSINGNTSNLVWDGPTGTLTNAGETTLQGISRIQNNLTIGVDGNNHQLLVYGDDVDKNLLWVNHKLSINGLLDVSDKTTLNGELETFNNIVFRSDTIGKNLQWTYDTNTLKINGITELCGQVTINSVANSTVNIDSNIYCEKPFQINDTLTVGSNELGYQFKVYGCTSNRYMEWLPDSNKLNVYGLVDILEKLTTNSDICINGQNNGIQWSSLNSTLTVDGISNFNNEVNIHNNIIVHNTGSLRLNGSDNNTYIEWSPDKLTIESDVDMLNKQLQLIDTDLNIISCSNDYYIKWDKDCKSLAVNSTKTTISGELEINNSPTDSTKSLVWDNNDTLTCNSNVIIQNDDLTVINGNVEFTDNTNSVLWNSVNASLNISSDLNINYVDQSCNIISDYSDNSISLNVDTTFTKNLYINGTSDSITWNGSLLTIDSNVVSNKNITINGCDNCHERNVSWTCTTGTLVADSIVRLRNPNDTCNIVWDNVDNLTINSNIDILDVNSNTSINWNKDNNILTGLDCNVILQNALGTMKVDWNPNDKLHITSPVRIDGSLTTNNDVQINGCDQCSNDFIKWTCSTGTLEIDSTLLLVQNESTFNGPVTINNDTTLGGCDNNHHVKWVSNSNLLTVTSDSVFNGDVTICDHTHCPDNTAHNITWNSTNATLDINANTVTMQGDNIHSTEWDQSNNRLTVTGSLVKTPITTDVSNDICLDMNNNNNFHLSLTGNINLVNPINPCPGQEGRIVIKTNSSGRTISYGNHWIFQDCVQADLTNGQTYDVLVYYVYSETEIFVRMEHNYGCPPSHNC